MRRWTGLVAVLAVAGALAAGGCAARRAGVCCAAPVDRADGAALPRDAFEHAAGGIVHRVRVVAPARANDADAPPVLLLHELPGLTPETLRLAHRLADAGFTVYLPHLFGEPLERHPVRNLLALLVGCEWRLLDPGDSGPIVGWCRSLVDAIAARHPGRGVGAIGMCLTGAFPLALVGGRARVVPVLSQPSLPLRPPFGSPCARFALGLPDATLHAARERLQAEGTRVLGLRFALDAISPAERFGTLREVLGPLFVDRTVTPEEYSGPGWTIEEDAHAVLTMEYRDVPGHPSRQRVEETIAFLRASL